MACTSWWGVFVVTPSPTAAKGRRPAAQVEVSAWRTARCCHWGGPSGSWLNPGTVAVFVTRERFDAPLLAPVDQAVRQPSRVTVLSVAKIVLRDRPRH